MKWFLQLLFILSGLAGILLLVAILLDQFYYKDSLFFFSDYLQSIILIIFAILFKLFQHLRYPKDK